MSRSAAGFPRASSELFAAPRLHGPARSTKRASSASARSNRGECGTLQPCRAAKTLRFPRPIPQRGGSAADNEITVRTKPRQIRHGAKDRNKKGREERDEGLSAEMSDARRGGSADARASTARGEEAVSGRRRIAPRIAAKTPGDEPSGAGSRPKARAPRRTPQDAMRGLSRRRSRAHRSRARRVGQDCDPKAIS